MTWTQVYVARREVGCVCMCVGGWSQTHVEGVCNAGSCSYLCLYSGLSAGKKQLICSLIHIYQELRWERERCWEMSLIQPPDRKANGWHAISLIRKTQGLYLVCAGSACLTHHASKALELNHLQERKRCLSVCLHFYMSLISIVAGLLQTRKVCELRERVVFVFHISSHGYLFLL